MIGCSDGECGICVDPNSDESHCGACNNPCGEDQVCSNSSCVNIDGDGDGFVSDFFGGDDCDDQDPSINPGASEAPPSSYLCWDNIDNDCDGGTDIEDDICSKWRVICNDNGWCWENPLPQPNTLEGIWGSSPDDIWAVGQRGTILHWDGTNWVGTIAGWAYPCNDIWGSSATNIWAVGNKIIHYDGYQWSVVAEIGAPHTLQGIWGTAADDIWAVGGYGNILRWDGSNWNSVQSRTTNHLYDVHGTSEDDVWIVGVNTVLHWDGNELSSVNTPASGYLYGVLALAEDAVWVVGVNGQVNHWNGSSWSRNDVGVNGFSAIWGAVANDLWAAGNYIFHWDGDTWSSAYSYSDAMGPTYDFMGFSQSDVWAVGINGKIFHWDGTRWSNLLTTLDNEQTDYDRQWNAVWAISSEDAWVGGAFGFISHRNENGWSPIERSGLATVEDIWGSSSCDVWMVGRDAHAGSNVIHWNCQDWSPVFTGENTTLQGIWGTDSNDVWAVGEGGTIIHWDGNVWTRTESWTTASLHDVWGVSSSEIWAVGEQGTILKWDGGGWSVVAIDEYSDMCITGVWGSASNDIWAVGGSEQCHGDTVVLHWDGSSWSIHQDAINRNGLNKVWGSSEDDVWVVTARTMGVGLQLYGSVSHWDGTGWSTAYSRYYHPLTDVHGSSAQNIWVVGYSGVIIRYDPEHWSR
jgi:hypothetical protein